MTCRNLGILLMSMLTSLVMIAVLAAIVGCEAAPTVDPAPIAPLAPVAPKMATIGQPAPEIAGNLALHRGNVVVVTFWATWCGPCRAAIPDERRLYAKHLGGLSIVGVSLDADAKTMDAFARRNGMYGGAWVNVLDAGRTIAATYAVTSIPATFVIDRDGVLQGRFSAGKAREIDAMVTTLVAAK